MPFEIHSPVPPDRAHLHCTERSAVQVSGLRAARPFRPVGLTARTGCRQGYSTTDYSNKKTACYVASRFL